MRYGFLLSENRVMWIPWFTFCKYVSMYMVEKSSAAYWSILNIFIRWISVLVCPMEVGIALPGKSCHTMYANIAIKKIIIIETE